MGSWVHIANIYNLSIAVHFYWKGHIRNQNKEEYQVMLVTQMKYNPLSLVPGLHSILGVVFFYGPANCAQSLVQRLDPPSA